MKNGSSRAGATLMNSKSCGAGAMFMKTKALELEQCDFYDSSAARVVTVGSFLEHICQAVNTHKGQILVGADVALVRKKS